MLLEMIHTIDAAAELAVERFPRHRARHGQGVQAVGKPYVDVECHAVIGNSFDGSFLDRNGMLLKLFEISLR